MHSLCIGDRLLILSCSVTAARLILVQKIGVRIPAGQLFLKLMEPEKGPRSGEIDMQRGSQGLQLKFSLRLLKAVRVSIFSKEIDPD